jgi:hypothetical protein
VSLLLAVLGGNSVCAEPEREYRIENLLGDFVAYHDRGREADEEWRRSLWDSMLEERHPAVLTHLLYRKKEGEEREAYKRDCLRRFWEEVAPRMGEIAKLGEGIETRVHRTVREFNKHFPDFEPRTDFCLTISLRFRGKVVDVDGRIVLALGLENLPREGPQLEITLAHELFHLHHFRTFSPKGGLYRALWTEGLATYASAVVVPAQRMSTVLGFPGSEVDRCGELLPKLAAELSAHLGERNHRLFRIDFGAERNDTEVPPGAGYYVGLLIVSKLAQSYSLAEMASWDKDRPFRVLSRELEFP